MTEPRDDTVLDGEAMALLEAFRAEEDIPGEIHERVWAAVQQRVEVRERHQTRRVVTWAAIGLGLAAAMVLVVGGTWQRTDDQTTSSARPEGDQAAYELQRGRGVHATMPGARQPGGLPPAPADAATPSLPTEAEAGIQGATPQVPHGNIDAEGRRPPRARSTSGGNAGPAAGPGTGAPDTKPADLLAEETRRMRAVAAALSTKDPEGALRLLDGWARDFPRGVLLQERQALRAIALCEAGRASEGRGVAEAFLRSYPAAALADRVRDACPG